MVVSVGVWGWHGVIIGPTNAVETVDAILKPVSAACGVVVSPADDVSSWGLGDAIFPLRNRIQLNTVDVPPGVPICYFAQQSLAFLYEVYL